MWAHVRKALSVVHYVAHLAMIPASFVIVLSMFSHEVHERIEMYDIWLHAILGPGLLVLSLDSARDYLKSKLAERRRRKEAAHECNAAGVA